MASAPPIIAELADGTELEFPAGTSDEVVHAAVRNRTKKPDALDAFPGAANLVDISTRMAKGFGHQILDPLTSAARGIPQIPGALKDLVGGDIERGTHNALDALSGFATGKQAYEDMKAASDRQAGEFAKTGSPVALAGTVAGAVPVIGPQVEGALNQAQEGDIAGGLGRAAAIALPFLVGGEGAAPARTGLARSLAEAETRVRGMMRGRPAVPAADFGDQIRPVMRSNREVAGRAAGGAIDEALSPIIDKNVDASDLLDNVKTMVDRQPDLAMARMARKQLNKARIREEPPPDAVNWEDPTAPPEGKLTKDIPVKDLRNISEQYGNKVKYIPPRAQGQALPLRQGVEETLKQAFDQPEREAYDAALGGYKDFADTYKRGINKKILNPAMEQDAASAGSTAVSSRAARMAPRAARAIQDALAGDGPEALDARNQLRSQVIDYTLRKGVERLPETLTEFHPDVLKIHLGAGDAEALSSIAQRVRQIRGPLDSRLAAVVGSPLGSFLPRVLRWSAGVGQGGIRRLNNALGDFLAGDPRQLAKIGGLSAEEGNQNQVGEK